MVYCFNAKAVKLLTVPCVGKKLMLSVSTGKKGAAQAVKKSAGTFKEHLTVAHYTVLMFSVIILAGTLLLMLPVSHKQPLSLIDALFTATSATCVTGLLTINVAEVFTGFGQAVIMILMELGAIGIITVSSLFLLMLGESVSMKNSSIIHDTFTASQRVNINRLVKRIVIYLLAFEVSGALLFAYLWWPELGFGSALFHGAFHAVSAFCNAGISTFADGLIGFDKDIPSSILFVVLLVAGGIGFLTIGELFDRLKLVFLSKKKRAENRWRWSLQIKVIMIYTFLSIAVSSLFILIFEEGNAHSGMPIEEQIVSSVFHAASSRTAGFSTVDISSFSDVSLYIFIILMFIGGAPVSTAGGIKVTTLAVIIGMGLSRIRGREKTDIMNRSIPEHTISRAVSIVFISIIVLVVSIFLLLITESQLNPIHINERGYFLSVLFEAVSAFGTVGLSIGITPLLSDYGKIIITLLMIMGRLGPLTVAMVVATGKREAHYQFAEEPIMIG